MLSELPAGTLEEWYEYFRLHPWGDDWLQMSVATTTVANEIRTIAAGFGGGKFKPLEHDALVPYQTEDQSEAEVAAALDALDAMTGL